MTDPLSSGRRAVWAAAATAVALACGAWLCVDLMWACDDAYITFRYSANLVDGYGLVYNPGSPAEHVEGYSNFSWTMLMAAGLWLGVARDSLWVWAGWWGLLFHLATALVVARASWGMARRLGTRPLPVAAIALSLHYYWASLAAGGLETALFTLLVTLLAVQAAACRGKAACVGLGVAAALACLTRPDGALPSTSVGVWLILDALRYRRLGITAREGWLRVLVYGSSAAALLVPHLLWRHAFYGEWVPNTAFAKSASEPYLARGLDYVGWYFAIYWVVAVGAVGLGVAVLGGGRRRAGGDGGSEPQSRDGAAVDAVASPAWAPSRIAGIALAIAVPYLAFVVWVGGDFMFSRFLLPITPLLYLGFETAWAATRCLWCDVVRVAVATLGTVLVAPPAWLGDYTNPHGFSDNRAISLAPLVQGGPTRLQAYLDAGAMVRDLTRGLDVRVGLHGSHANLAYSGRFPVAIETAAGLTDGFIARLPVAHRGMVGHEKHFRQFRGYLEKRGVLVNFHLHWRGGDAIDGLTDATGRPLRQIVFVHPDHPGVILPGVLVTYRKDLLDEIAARSPGCDFVRFDEWLDREYLPSVGQRPVAVVQHHLEAMDRYYFDHNPDPERRRPIAERAGQQ